MPKKIKVRDLTPAEELEREANLAKKLDNTYTSVDTSARLARIILIIAGAVILLFTLGLLVFGYGWLVSAWVACGLASAGCLGYLVGKKDL